MRLRTLLIVRPDEGAGVAAALAAAPDAILLDLAGAADRRAVSDDLASLARQVAGTGAPPLVFARIRPLTDAQSWAELRAFVGAGIDGILLPDAIGRAAIEHLGARLAVLEAEHELVDGSIRVLASIASARGALAVGALADAGQRLAGIAWDAASLAGDIGAADAAAEPCRQLRSAVVLAARAAGVAAIDTACMAGTSLESLAREAAAARRDGFSGKLASDPREVEVIARAFEET